MYIVALIYVNLSLFAYFIYPSPLHTIIFLYRKKGVSVLTFISFEEMIIQRLY